MKLNEKRCAERAVEAYQQETKQKNNNIISY